MYFLKLVILGAAGLYLATLLYVYIAQRQFLYFPPTVPVSAAALAERGEHILPISLDGIGNIDSVYRPPPTVDAPVILFFHGNGSAAWQYTEHFDAFQSWGAGYLGVEYPGYAGNLGAPNEADILRMALASYDALIAKGVAPKHIIIFGHSLGAACAVYVAKHREGAGLILTAPFLSMLAMGRLQMPYFPTRILLRDTYRSDQWIASVDEALLVLHGDADTLIPIEQAKALLGLHTGDKKFITIKNGQHNLWGEQEARHIKAFVDGRRRP